jgi:hypothetical protein
MNRRAQDLNIRVQGVPNEPTGEFALEPTVFLQVYREGGWKELREIIRAEQERLDRLSREEVPTADEQATALTAELEKLRDELEQASTVRIRFSTIWGARGQSSGLCGAVLARSKQTSRRIEMRSSSKI